jgi:EpsI family protein
MMKLISLTGGSRAWAIGFMLLATALLAAAWTPERRLTAQAAAGVDLERMIPDQFGQWRHVSGGADPTIKPELQAKVEATYVLTLGRVYANAQGDRVMLSIAYGSNQLSDQTQSHRPEYCYTAQGFLLSDSSDDELPTALGVLPLRRLHAAQPGRSEPISYWMTIGDRAILPGLGRKLAQLRYGLSGEVPDGLLIRISSLDRDSSGAYALHDRFIQDLLPAVADPGRFGLYPADRESR